MIVKLILGLLWCLIHLVISLFDLWSHMRNSLECYLISCEMLPKYRNLHLEKLEYLGVVVDSREAINILKVKQLLRWLSTIGIKYVVLYDIEGVLKKMLKPDVGASRDEKSRDPLETNANTKGSHCSDERMTVECLSGSDGKRGIAKAANLLCSAFCSCDTHGYDKSNIIFTEADMACALGAVGSGGPEPDLLVYGPARCHLGFPAWRLRYTEIMHMGSLKSMKYGSLVKALYQFLQKYQKYGKLSFQLGTVPHPNSLSFLHRKLYKCSVHVGQHSICNIFFIFTSAFSRFFSSSFHCCTNKKSLYLLHDQTNIPLKTHVVSHPPQPSQFPPKNPSQL